MKFDELKRKFKEYDWKGFFTSRGFIIVCAVLFIGAGITVYGVISRTDNQVNTESGKKILGNSILVDSEVSAENAAAEDETGFFAVQVINRERTRDEALEVLRQIADSADAMPDAKTEAVNSISSLVTDMNAETKIETLVKAKGFEECIAIVSGEKCTVIVKSDSLGADEVAQILEIASSEANIPASGVKIINSEAK